MAKKKQAEPTEKPIDFESALADVESVVQQLESGELGLSESLAEYERGIEKIKQCHQVLENAERRIAVLTSVDDDGTAHTEPVDTSPSAKSMPTEKPKPQAPKSRAKKRPAPPITDVDDQEGLF